MSIRYTSNNFEMLNCWSPSAPSVFRHLITNTFSWTFVKDKTTTFFRHLFRLRHVSHHIFDCPNLPFGNFILLGSIFTCQLITNSMLLEEICTIGVLLTFICSPNFTFAIALFVHKCICF